MMRDSRSKNAPLPGICPACGAVVPTQDKRCYQCDTKLPKWSYSSSSFSSPFSFDCDDEPQKEDSGWMKEFKPEKLWGRLTFFLRIATICAAVGVGG